MKKEICALSVITILSSSFPVFAESTISLPSTSVNPLISSGREMQPLERYPYDYQTEYKYLRSATMHLTQEDIKNYDKLYSSFTSAWMGTLSGIVGGPAVGTVASYFASEAFKNRLEPGDYEIRAYAANMYAVKLTGEKRLYRSGHKLEMYYHGRLISSQTFWRS